MCIDCEKKYNSCHSKNSQVKCEKCTDPCKPKCSPCKKQAPIYYCGKDNKCVGLKRGDRIEQGLQNMGDILCDLKHKNLSPYKVYYENTLFVDDKYGDDSAAQRERFDLPYKDLQTALNSAQNGDLIYVRSSTINDKVITLKEGVNIHFENTSMNRCYIVDGNAIETTITGNLYFNKSYVTLTYNKTSLDIRIKNVNTPGDVFIIGNNNMNYSDGITLNAEIDFVKGFDRGKFIGVECKSFINVRINHSFDTFYDTNSTNRAYNIIDVSKEASGTLNFYCPVMYMKGFVDSQNRFFNTLFYEDGVPVGSPKTDYDITLSVDKIYSSTSYDNEQQLSNIGLISKRGSSNLKVFADIKSLWDVIQVGDSWDSYDQIIDVHPGTLYFEGKIETEFGYPIKYSSNQKTTIKNSYIYRDCQFLKDLNSAILVGYNPYLKPYTMNLYSNIGQDFNLNIINTEVVADTFSDEEELTGELNSGVICLSEQVDVTGVKLLNVHLIDTNSVGKGIEGDKPNLRIYCKDVLSNVDLGNNITVISPNINDGYDYDVNFYL